jgi:hypothetical protein
MRTYKLIDAFEVVSKSFAFLHEEWKFELLRSDNFNYGCYFEYLKGKLKIYLGYDYKDNFFYFEFIVNGNHVSFINFFKEKEPNIDWKIFKPNDYQYKESLLHNVQYLKKYKDEILKMEE